MAKENFSVSDRFIRSLMSKNLTHKSKAQPSLLANVLYSREVSTEACRCHSSVSEKERVVGRGTVDFAI